MPLRFRCFEVCRPILLCQRIQPYLQKLLSMIASWLVLFIFMLYFCRFSSWVLVKLVRWNSVWLILYKTNGWTRLLNACSCPLVIPSMFLQVGIRMHICIRNILWACTVWHYCLFYQLITSELISPIFPFTGNIYRLENHSTTKEATLFWMIVYPMEETQQQSSIGGMSGNTVVSGVSY